VSAVQVSQGFRQAGRQLLSHDCFLVCGGLAPPQLQKYKKNTIC
jgi:hypothetical protein